MAVQVWACIQPKNGPARAGIQIESLKSVAAAVPGRNGRGSKGWIWFLRLRFSASYRKTLEGGEIRVRPPLALPNQLTSYRRKMGEQSLPLRRSVKDTDRARCQIDSNRVSRPRPVYVAMYLFMML